MTPSEGEDRGQTSLWATLFLTAWTAPPPSVPPAPPNPQCLLLSWLREEVLSDMFFCLVVLLLLILKCGPYTDLV